MGKSLQIKSDWENNGMNAQVKRKKCSLSGDLHSELTTKEGNNYELHIFDKQLAYLSYKRH